MALPDRASRICSMAEAAFTAKGSLDSFWQEVAEIHFPERADFTTSKDASDDWASSIYDSTPAQNRRDFADWLGASLRPKGRNWFRGKVRDEELADEQTVREWLSERDNTLRNLLYDNRSQFIHAMKLADHDYCTFGNAVTSAEPRADRSGMLYRTWHLRDCAWLENADGEVDTVFRKFKLSVSQLCRKEKASGWDIPQKIKDRLDKGATEKVKCLHVELPSDSYYITDKPERGKGKYREYCSVYICEDTKDVLFEEMRDEQRYAVSRWFRIGSPYAVSPCTVLSQPDARTLQSMTWSIMQAGENAVEPPLVGQSEVVLGPVNLFPGGITWVDKNYDERYGRAIEPLNLGKAPDLGVSLHGVMKEQLATTWYLNKLFLPPSDTGDMTAQEVERRWQEFMRVTQPIIEPAEPERNGRILDLTWNVAMAMGWLMSGDEELPQELEGENIDWAYDNPIEDARKQATLMSFDAALQLTQAAASVNPKLAARFNIEQAFEDAMAVAGEPDWLNEKEDPDVEAAEAEIEQATTMQGAMNEAGQIAEIAKTAGEAGL